MKRNIFFILVLTTAVFPLMSLAQDQNAGINQSESKTTAEPANLSSPYRVVYTWSELDDGKKINTRNYTVLVGVRGYGNIRVGSRVPVVTGSTLAGSNAVPTQYQMMDIGVNIDSRITAETPDGLKILSNLDSTSFSQNSDTEDNHNRPPVVHQIKLSLETVVPANKRTVLSTVDDPGSKRSFQLEVIATKEK